jgi:hypothetical protein
MDTKIVTPLDQDLDRLEVEIRKLKVEYDIFFNGGAMRPPMDTKGRVETAIKRLYDSKGLSFSQRFRYNSLVARYNVMRELWRRQTQEREESGRPPTSEAHTALREHLTVIRCHDPKVEPEKISELYDHLIAAKREVGERVGSLTFERFSKFIEARSAQIKSRLKTNAVDFVIGVDGGQVKFSARAAGKERK